MKNFTLLSILTLLIMPVSAADFYGVPTAAELQYQPGLEYQLPENFDKDLNNIKYDQVNKNKEKLNKKSFKLRFNNNGEQIKSNKLN